MRAGKFKAALNLPAIRRCRSLVRQLAAPSILRLSLGRTATPTERRDFNFGFNDQYANMPPLFHGLLAVPDGRNALLHSARIAWHRARAQEKGGAITEFSELDGNIFAAWTGRKLAFLHIEKCGGCALLAWLAQHFHPEQINADPCRDLPPHLFLRLRGNMVVRPMIWGHYDIPSLLRFDPGRAIFTVLREPRARLVSLYYFWRSVDPAKFDPNISFALGYAHRLSIEDFLNLDDPYLIDMIDNIYVRRLTGFYATGANVDRLQIAPKDSLSRAAEVLNKLYYVGITEEMDRSAAGLAARLNIAPPAQPLRRNITAENHHDPSGWFRKIGHTELTRRTVLDRELYAQAGKKFCF